jgi:hypothetical protein
MKRIERILITTLAVVACNAVPASAQDRAALIEQARAMFDDSAAVQTLHRAMDPALGGPDSLWALAGFRLATVFLRMEESDRAARWLRAVVRNAPSYPIDPVNFPPNVVAAFESAAAEVGAQPDAGVAATSWQWPSSLNENTEGTIEVASVDAQLNVDVMSVGPIQPGGIMSLPPGT